MNKKVIISIIVIFLSIIIYGQSDYKEISNDTEIRSKLSKTAKTTRSIKSDFIQEKHLTM